LPGPPHQLWVDGRTRPRSKRRRREFPLLPDAGRRPMRGAVALEELEGPAGHGKVAGEGVPARWAGVFGGTNDLEGAPCGRRISIPPEEKVSGRASADRRILSLRCRGPIAGKAAARRRRGVRARPVGAPPAAGPGGGSVNPSDTPGLAGGLCGWGAWGCTKRGPVRTGAFSGAVGTGRRGLHGVSAHARGWPFRGVEETKENTERWAGIGKEYGAARSRVANALETATHRDA